MASSCGIDLGTTNSCIVLATEDGPLVVRDEYNRATVPSVVYLDGSGKLIVGHNAKARMGSVPAPVATIKRKMGTDERVRLGERDHDAVEVSAMILKHLKAMGEKAGGETLDNVVVTVPAYFSHKQKQDTERAAEQAGFKQIVVLQEPVAAALAFCVSAGDQPMIVLAYDLGGGTFDATVLERTPDNEIKVLACGGDPYLGGDDFDTLLAEQIRLLLKERNYAVTWDKVNNRDHAAKFQRLKVIAENCKIQLSTTPEAAIPNPNVFKDEEGTTVDLDEIITRQVLHALIDAKLERSIELTKKTLEESGLPIEKVTKLIMVGGSSYIPKIRQRLKETFGIEPELVDPETVVAMGAAIKAAASFGRRITGKDVSVDLDYPSRTNRPKVRINGRLSQAVTGWTVTLSREEYERSDRIEGRAGFRFDDVELRPGETNEIALAIADENGAEALFAEISITHDPETRIMRTPEALVAKPISVRVVGGLEKQIESGARLPIKVKATFVTQDQSGSIRVPIYEGGIQIGEISLPDVPKTLPVGSEVDVEIEFKSDYRVAAVAHVRDTGQQVTADFNIPPVEVLPAAEVMARLQKLRSRWDIGIKAGAIGETSDLERTEKQIHDELSTPEPKLAKVAEDLSVLELIVASAEAEAHVLQAMRPSLPDLELRLTEVAKRAAEKGVKDGSTLEEFRVNCETVRQEARRHWQNRDVLGWRDVVSKTAAVERIAEPAFDIDKMPPEEQRKLATDLALLLQGEANRDPRARAHFAGVDPRALLVGALEHPREAISVGFTILGRLIDAGIVKLDGDPGRTTTNTSAPTVAALQGLLGRRG